MKKIEPIRIVDGIHTIEISQKAGGYHYIRGIIAPIFEIAHETNDENMIHVLKSDKHKMNELFEVNYNFPEGLAMKINKAEDIEFNYIKYILNPSSLSNGQFIPEQLYIPVKDARIIENTMDDTIYRFNILGKDVHKDWKFRRDKLSISRIDFTRDIYFNSNVDLTEMIRLFKKAYKRHNYKMDSFKDERDLHSFRINSSDKSQTITVYDKAYEIKNHRNNHDAKYNDLNILRIEISLKRSEYIKMLYETYTSKKLGKMTFDEVLYHIYTYRNRIFRKYINMVFRCNGRHLPYDVAERIIRKEVDSSIDRERMLYFMNKVSNSFTYGTAMRKTMEYFKMSKSAFMRMERLFNEINVNPITFIKNSDTKSIDSFCKVLFDERYYSGYTGEFLSTLNGKLKMIGFYMGND